MNMHETLSIWNNTLRNDIDALIVGRKAYQSMVVEAAIPSISGKVLTSLRTDFPSFVSADVVTVFGKHSRRLGFLRRHEYLAALLKLRSDLAHEMTRIGYGALAGIDRQIRELEGKGLSRTIRA